MLYETQFWYAPCAITLCLVNKQIRMQDNIDIRVPRYSFQKLVIQGCSIVKSNNATTATSASLLGSGQLLLPRIQLQLLRMNLARLNIGDVIYQSQRLIGVIACLAYL